MIGKILTTFAVMDVSKPVSLASLIIRPYNEKYFIIPKAAILRLNKPLLRQRLHNYVANL